MFTITGTMGRAGITQDGSEKITEAFAHTPQGLRNQMNWRSVVIDITRGIVCKLKLKAALVEDVPYMDLEAKSP